MPKTADARSVSMKRLLPLQKSNGKLFEAPFTEVSSKGLLDVFTADQANEMVALLEQVNQYSEVG